MAKYRIEGSIVDTDNSSNAWDEERYFDGHNMISVNTGSQWHHETLYRSRKGRYYIERTSNYQGSRDTAEWVSPQEAVRWLLLNEHEIPSDLTAHIAEILE